MKKVIVGILGFAMLFASHGNASAVTVWNGSSSDCKGIAIADYTTNTGIVQPCWPLSTVNANAGDSVNVRIYYHNTSGATATNVRILLNAPTVTGSTQVFSGQIVSDQGSLSLGTVTAYIPYTSKLVFGGTHWLPNQSQTESTLLYGQAGSEILSGSGLNIGSIDSSWAAQGSVVVSFLVTKPDPTGTITPSTPTCEIQAGQSSCSIPFSWNTENPIGTSVVTKDGLSGNYKTGNSGSNVPFSISNGTSIFRLYNNAKELDSASVSASCASGTNWDNSSSTCKKPVYDCKINSFTGSPLEISYGGTAKLTWSTENCSYVNISGVGNGLSANSSSTVSPGTTTTYTLTGYGDTSATPTASVQITAGGPAGAPGYPAGAPGYSN